MRTARLLLVLLMSSLALAQRPTVLLVSDAFDGRGHVLHNSAIVIEDGKIARIGPLASALNPHPQDLHVYDLRGLTVLPAWIDTHVHIGWHFGPNGPAPDPSETPQQAALP